MHRKIPSDENLRAHGCLVVFVCILYMKTDEYVGHHFFCCPFAVELCLWLSTRLNCVVDLTSVHTILLCVPTLFSSKVSNMFVAAIDHTLHTIWMAHNILRFNFDKAIIHATKVKKLLFCYYEW